MIVLFLIAGLFLGWSFGRINISNVFGSAIGTRMVSLKTAATLTGLFVFLGAIISGQATTESVLQLTATITPSHALIISLCIGLVLFLVGRLGIPVSMVQASVGCLIGLNLYNHIKINWLLVANMAKTWILSPLIALVFSLLLFKGIRFILYRIQVPLLYRDVIVRILLIITGIFSAYALGANNISTLIGPYQATGLPLNWYITCVICLGVGIGAQMADKKVINTVSAGLFPLSSIEAWVVIFSSAMTLLFFSSTALSAILKDLGFTIHSVPIPASCTLIGSILGISCAKGGKGINFYALLKIMISWFMVPLFSCLICFAFLSILGK
ncbi:MAG: anion permease [Alphaproteobacteria bacterium]|nr:anion permease [Alphaproteobacteria bacterium]